LAGGDPCRDRIAICGETADASLPSSPTLPNPAAMTPAGTLPFTGFIAVYSGDLSLQWSYHFYADSQATETTITDVAIRVEPDPSGQLREYVTYCGATTNGNSASGPASTMLPIAPFTAPPPFGGDTYAGGAADNGAAGTQWDGIVGRLSSPVGAPLVNRDFHSIVGGSGDDVLLGIAQNSLKEFVVVGSTQRGSLPPGPLSLAFPLTAQNMFAGGTVDFSVLPGWTFGTALRFRVNGVLAANATNPSLALSDSRVIGSQSSRTIARDVLWQDAPGVDWIYVVGSTDFTALAAEPALAGQSVGTFSGGATGFLLGTPALALGWLAGRYVDGPPGAHLSSGAIGVSAWNEYHDHIAVSGWLEYSGGTTRMLVTSCFREPSSGVPVWPGITAVRQLVADGPPAANPRSDYPGPNLGGGMTHAFTALPPSLAPGRITSGGIAVSPNGHVTVVGSTLLPPAAAVTEFPIAGPPSEIRNSQGLLPALTQMDALRLRVDMLPYGVCRIEGDALQCGPSTGVVGGTTPACALSQFGSVLAPAALERVFIDVDGVPAPGASISILVDRPINAAVAIGTLWLGLPVLTPSPIPGIEVWGDVSTAVTFGTIPFDESWRLALPPLPLGSATFTIQFLSLFLPLDYCVAASGCGPNPLCQAGSVFNAAASPALLFTY
jgi:hypothetical protein